MATKINFSETIHLSDIIPTHNSLRNPKIIPGLQKTILSNEDFFIKCPIFLSRVEEKIYLHDAHHRCYAAFLCGKEFFSEGEYLIKDMTYEMYNSINRKVGYVTPFDLRTEVRISHFWPVKKILIKMRDYEIYQNKHLYCEERRIWTLKDIS